MTLKSISNVVRRIARVVIFQLIQTGTSFSLSSVGFVSEHRALSDKPVSDMKMKIFDAENEDEKLSIFRKIEFSL